MLTNNLKIGFLFLMFIIAGVIISCREEEKESTPTVIVLTDASTQTDFQQWLAANRTSLATMPRTQFISLPAKFRLQIYNELPAAAKYAMWKDKIEEALPIPAWNNEQSAHLLKMKKFLCPGIFEDTPEAAEFRRDILEVWVKDSESLFEKAMLAPIVNSLDNAIYNQKSGRIELEQALYTSCNCSQNSSWCNCQPSACAGTGTGLGCGTLMMYRCDGRCQ